MKADRRPSLVVLDPVGGISGDMFIAAVLDAWPELAETVLAAIRASGLPAGCTVALEPRRSAGLAAKGFAFAGDREAPSGDYRDIRRRLEAAPLSDGVRGHALGLLELLARAEADVHGVPVERVHFHELADWDSQADLVGAAAIADALDGTRWRCRPLPMGSGSAPSAHGPLPVPAPAAVRLLEGFRFRDDDGVPGERVTPTGAAILRHLDAGAAAEGAPGRLVTSGMGAGTHQVPGFPNVLRVLGFAAEAAGSDAVLLIEFDIDDQSPEELATGLDRLRQAPGVRDVVTFQGVGKKGRWVQAVRVMADPLERERVLAAVFDETATIGLRIRREERSILPRELVTVESGAGPVRVKVADRPRGRTAKAESDDVAAQGRGASGRARLRVKAARAALGKGRRK